MPHDDDDMLVGDENTGEYNPDNPNRTQTQLLRSQGMTRGEYRAMESADFQRLGIIALGIVIGLALHFWVF